MNELYMRMKLKGIDMSWYERGKKALNEAIPLVDDECSKEAIYLMKADGTVWTLKLKPSVVTDGEGKPLQDDKGNTVFHYEGLTHKQVRSTGKVIKQDTYVCMHTKVAYDGLDEALAHRQCKTTNDLERR